MNTKLIILLCAALPLAAAGQIGYNGGTYTQDFNSLESGIIYHHYTALPTGWVVSKGSYVWTTVTNGYSNNYGTYCFSSTASDPDKAIGLVIGSTGQAYLGARFRNVTGVTLTSFLSYFAEQWAKGAVASNDQAIPFEYSLEATGLTSGVFTNVAALDMHSINDGNGSGGALDGNAAANRTLVAATVAGISRLPAQDLWIRWKGVSYPFFGAHALAVDDFSFRAVPGWDTVTNVPVIEGGECGVELDAAEALRFFRLKNAMKSVPSYYPATANPAAASQCHAGRHGRRFADRNCCWRR